MLNVSGGQVERVELVCTFRAHAAIAERTFCPDLEVECMPPCLAAILSKGHKNRVVNGGQGGHARTAPAGNTTPGTPDSAHTRHTRPPGTPDTPGDQAQSYCTQTLQVFSTLTVLAGSYVCAMKLSNVLYVVSAESASHLTDKGYSQSTYVCKYSQLRKVLCTFDNSAPTVLSHTCS